MQAIFLFKAKKDRALFKRFYPKEYVMSAYTIDFQKYYEQGYRALILDVDNTLVEHGAPVNEKAKAFFEKVRGIGFKTCIISNNNDARVSPFAEAVDSPYIADAGKPKKEGYLKAMQLMESEKNNTLFIGDQLFTDVWGANRTGVYSILVHYIKYDYEIQIRLKRLGEKIVLYFYKKTQGN